MREGEPVAPKTTIEEEIAPGETVSRFDFGLSAVA